MVRASLSRTSNCCSQWLNSGFTSVYGRLFSVGASVYRCFLSLVHGRPDVHVANVDVAGRLRVAFSAGQKFPKIVSRSSQTDPKIPKVDSKKKNFLYAGAPSWYEIYKIYFTAYWSVYGVNSTFFFLNPRSKPLSEVCSAPPPPRTNLGRTMADGHRSSDVIRTAKKSKKKSIGLSNGFDQPSSNHWYTDKKIWFTIAFFWFHGWFFSKPMLCG